MKKKIFAIILTATLLFGITMAVSAEDVIKSQGNIVFDNGTSTSEDDVIFSAGDLTALNSRIDQLTTDVTTGKGKIATSIKAKDSTATVTGESTFDSLAASISNIGKAGTAIASTTLAGKTYYNGTGYTTGSMVDKSDSTATVTPAISGNTGTVTIPENGFYNTSAKLSFDLTSNNNYYYEQGYANGSKSAVPTVITNSDSAYSSQSVSYDDNGGSSTTSHKWRQYRNLIFDIKSVYANYASLTADNFYFCITASQAEHYITSGCNIGDPNPFTMEKVYDPSTGQLTIKNVDGASYEQGNDPGRITFTITGFKLLIL